MHESAPGRFARFRPTPFPAHTMPVHGSHVFLILPYSICYCFVILLFSFRLFIRFYFMLSFRIKPCSNFVRPFSAWAMGCVAGSWNLVATRRQTEQRWHWRLRRKRKTIRKFLRWNPFNRLATALRYRAILDRHHGSAPPMVGKDETSEWNGKIWKVAGDAPAAKSKGESKGKGKGKDGKGADSGATAGSPDAMSRVLPSVTRRLAAGVVPNSGPIPIILLPSPASIEGPEHLLPDRSPGAQSSGAHCR